MRLSVYSLKPPFTSLKTIAAREPVPIPRSSVRGAALRASRVGGIHGRLFGLALFCNKYCHTKTAIAGGAFASAWKTLA